MESNTTNAPPAEASTPKPAPARPKFGRVALPAIGYFQGSRRMVTTVMTPVTLTDQAGPREAWDPLHGTGTNRKEDVNHRKGIAAYIQDREDYVIGAILAYLDPNDAEFIPDDPIADQAGSPTMGTLWYRPGAKIVIGDGGHRTSAFGDVVEAHRDINDEVFQRMSRNGQPLIIVLDGDRTNRARDFVTLQNNAKPLNQSVAQSMNIDHALNKALLERVIKGDAVPVFDGGNRVEFLTDSPGKLSAKLASYKTIRYASGTLLIGTGHRSTKGWDENVTLALARADADSADDPVGDLIEFWNGYGNLPAVAAAQKTEGGVALLRADTWLTSANLIYAIAAAVHMVKAEVPTAEAFAALSQFDFARTGTGLYGTLVEPPTKKEDGTVTKPASRTGREAWESAAQVLADFILDHRPGATAVMDGQHRHSTAVAAMKEVSPA